MESNVTLNLNIGDVFSLAVTLLKVPHNWKQESLSSLSVLKTLSTSKLIQWVQLAANVIVDDCRHNAIHEVDCQGTLQYRLRVWQLMIYSELVQVCNQFSLDKSLGPHITLDTQQGHGVWRMTVATLEPLYGKREQVVTVRYLPCLIRLSYRRRGMTRIVETRLDQTRRGEVWRNKTRPDEARRGMTRIGKTRQ